MHACMRVRTDGAKAEHRDYFCWCSFFLLYHLCFVLFGPCSRTSILSQSEVDFCRGRMRSMSCLLVAMPLHLGGRSGGGRRGRYIYRGENALS